MNQTEKRINKDLILREKLAIERTEMAIDRTLLSFIRTSLYFVIAGMTVNSLLKVSYGWWAEILFWFLGIVVLITGIIKSLFVHNLSYAGKENHYKVMVRHIKALHLSGLRFPIAPVLLQMPPVP